MNSLQDFWPGPLATGDVGLIPWVPLTAFDGPPEAMLQQCRERIDRQAPPNEHENLLAVTQVMAWLRYNDLRLLTLIGGRRTMIESTLIQGLLAERSHKYIVRLLTKRFGFVSVDIKEAVERVQDEDRLDELHDWAATCPDLEAFRARLTAG